MPVPIFVRFPEPPIAPERVFELAWLSNVAVVAAPSENAFAKVPDTPACRVELPVNAIVPLLSAPVLEKANVPALIDVGPEYVLVPKSESTPSPVLVRPAPPLMVSSPSSP